MTVDKEEKKYPMWQGKDGQWHNDRLPTVNDCYKLPNSNPTTLSVDETIKLPFEAKATGTFNGDMFYDWYNDKPTNEKELHFWIFLHNWEDSIKREADDKAIDKIREYLWQIKN